MHNLAQHIKNNVKNSLDEDINGGDLTAQLLPATLGAHAQVITRQTGVLCGTAWFNECFLALDPDCKISWQAKDGDSITPGQKLCKIKGLARALLTAERSALNLLQTLSGTATTTRRYVDHGYAQDPPWAARGSKIRRAYGRRT
jgi:nicotinate-nucleotide pyrophosphorylase (carboxylating)